MTETTAENLPAFPPDVVLPQHVGIIMDGNRRWARNHKLELFKGHEVVANEVIKKLVTRAAARGVKYLTLWAFSTENWKRDTQELESLMGLFRQAFTKNAAELHAMGVRLGVVGDISKFPQDIQENVAKWVAESAQNTKIMVVFALNYGGRDELIRAVQSYITEGSTAENLTEENLADHLDTAGIPDPDLIIRPGGEQRLSGFLPWQSVYSELYFTPTLMPDFGPEAFDEALLEFAGRQRRFGK